jgi:hypothetical protein
MLIDYSMQFEIAGMGFIAYSPAATNQIAEGEDYFSASYSSPEDVAKHLMAGTIVGFCTGSPGSYTLRLLSGYPTNEIVSKYQHAIRLAIQVQDGKICFRDLFDLMQWTRTCPDEHCLKVENGWYHLTVCTNVPESGRFGDNQRITIWMNSVEDKPAIRWDGVPNLC